MENAREWLEPGSPEKIALLAERCARGRSLFGTGEEPGEPTPPPEGGRRAHLVAPDPEPVRPPGQEEGTTPACSASTAEARLRAAGFVPGSPPHVGEYARCVDATTAAKMRCRQCRHRGLLSQPFRHRQTNAAYRVLAVCPECHCAEEM